MGSPAEALAASVSKAELIFTVLRRRIREVELAPGSRLQREDIAAEFHVSRAPVREAVSRLAAEGLVEVFHRSGSYVAPIRAAEVRECLFIRTALELETARRLARNPDPELVARLRDNLAAQEEALARGDLAALHDWDNNFHQIMSAALGARRVLRVLQAARTPLDRVRRLALPEGDRPSATVSEHRVLLDAIASGDPELATRAMRRHLTMTAEPIERALARLTAGRSPPP